MLLFGFEPNLAIMNHNVMVTAPEVPTLSLIFKQLRNVSARVN